jgi:hypothetical protein
MFRHWASSPSHFHPNQPASTWHQHAMPSNDKEASLNNDSKFYQSGCHDYSSAPAPSNTSLASYMVAMPAWISPSDRMLISLLKIAEDSLKKAFESKNQPFGPKSTINDLQAARQGMAGTMTTVGQALRKAYYLRDLYDQEQRKTGNEDGSTPGDTELEKANDDATARYKSVVDETERNWGNQVGGKIVNTAFMIATRYPMDKRMYESIYSEPEECSGKGDLEETGGTASEASSHKLKPQED